MVTKLYAFIWLVVVAAAGVVGFTGNFNEVTVTIFAFVVSTLVFAGVVAVLPWWIDKRYSWNY